MSYWSHSPPMHIALGGLLRAFGVSAPASSQFVPSSEADIKGLAQQFASPKKLGA